jgi:TolB-like protein/Tfp pilus assembly protein PilF
MISAHRLCPECARQIPADAPESGCSGYLLETVLGRVDHEVVVRVGIPNLNEGTPQMCQKKSKHAGECANRVFANAPPGLLRNALKWVRRKPAIAVLIASLAALLVAVGWNVCKNKLVPDKIGTAKGIAVLPFENLSADPDNAYFAEGIQEEISARLSKIADLKVISRNSTQYYHSKPRNLAQIANQLGVVNILEGSVRKAADQVRVNVQLIDVQTRSHLWADTYDRKLTDIVAVESEIARGIAESLQVKLTAREAQALSANPTNNLDAYEAYLRGLAFDARSAYSNDAQRRAIDSYERAVQIDPTFALAWARLSRADAALYFIRADQTPVRRDAARRALENAQELDPNLPETQLALGYYQYWVLRDYGLAENTFGLLRKMLPGSSDILYALGLVTRRQANWDKSLAYLEQALMLDPRNAEVLSNTAWTYALVRRFPAALKLYDRALEITPNDSDLITVKAGIYQAEGKLKEAAQLLSEMNVQSPIQPFITKITQLRLERNYAEAIRLLQARQTQFHFASQIDKSTNEVILAFMQRLAGDAVGVKTAAQEARNTVKPLCENQPDNSFFAQQLALANSAFGDKEGALKEAERAITLLPSAKDPLSGPTREEVLALIQMMFGESSRPVSTLSRLLQTPYISWLYGPLPATPALLRLDPMWDPLRTDRVFQKLCEEKRP